MSDLTEFLNPFESTEGTIRTALDPGDFSGQHAGAKAKDASKAAEAAQQDALGRSIAETRRATEEGQGFLAPFGGVGLQGVGGARFRFASDDNADIQVNGWFYQITEV